MKLADTSYVAGLHSRVPRLRLCAALLLCLVLYGCAPFSGNTNSPGAATPNMVNANLPVLGGSREAFTQKYGQPILLHDIFTFTAASGDRIFLALGTLQNFATGSIRVRTIILEPSDNKMWDATTAQALYEVFLPPDARFTHNGAGASGTYRFYTSTLLANTFPAQAFVDSAGKQLPPGTFEVVCNNHIMPSEGDAAGCRLTIGDWPPN